MQVHVDYAWWRGSSRTMCGIVVTHGVHADWQLIMPVCAHVCARVREHGLLSVVV